MSLLNSSGFQIIIALKKIFISGILNAYLGECNPTKSEHSQLRYNLQYENFMIKKVVIKKKKPVIQECCVKINHLHWFPFCDSLSMQFSSCCFYLLCLTSFIVYQVLTVQIPFGEFFATLCCCLS